MINNIDFKELESEKYWSFPRNTKKNIRDEAMNMIFSGSYLGARKMDGAYYRLVIDDDGSISLQGRNRSVNGDFLNKYDHVPHLHGFFGSLPSGTCLLGEIYFPDWEGSNHITTIMGCNTSKAIQRQEKGEHGAVHYYIFDIWAWNGESYLDKPAKERFKKLEEISQKYQNDYVTYAKYYDGAKLWDKLQEYLADGYEGVVITKKNSKPEPGKRTARKTLKIKKELQDTIDVIIIGANPPTKQYTGKSIGTWEYWFDPIENRKFKVEIDTYNRFMDGAPIVPVTKNWYNGWAGSLKIGVYRDGKVVQIGNLSGMEDEVLMNWKNYIGKVAEIVAMEIMDTEQKGLRHSRFLNWRSDKNPKDCQYEDIFGK